MIFSVKIFSFIRNFSLSRKGISPTIVWILVGLFSFLLFAVGALIIYSQVTGVSSENIFSGIIDALTGGFG